MSGRPIFVLGMHRSGTSVVSQMLSELGVYFGADSDLYAANEFNKEGYWEHRKIAWHHRKFELSLNLSHLGVDALPSEWREFPVSNTLVEQYRRLLEATFSDRPVWGWKDPDASWFLPFVLDGVRDFTSTPAFVICVRNPAEVCASQEAREGTPKQRTLAGWLRHTLAALADTNGFPRLIVSYDDVITEPEKVIANLQAFLPELSGSESNRDAARSAVRPEHYRNRDDSKIPGILGSMADHVFELGKGADDAAFQLEIIRLLGEFDALCEALISPIPTGIATFRVQSRPNPDESVCKFFPHRKWQTLSFEFEGKPGDIAVGRLYGSPGNVWVRQSIWTSEGSSRPIALEPGPDAGCFDLGLNRCFQVSAGADQVRFALPGSKGSLSVEVLIEVSNYLSTKHSETLLAQLRA